MMKTKQIALLGLCIVMVSCKDFLALKPETSYSHPETLEDINALLNYESRVNGNYVGNIESGTDDFEIDFSSYSTRSAYYQELYRWDEEPFSEDGGAGENWLFPYETILYANVALESLDRVKGGDPSLRKRLEGDALFIRSYRFFQLMQVYSPPYLEGDQDSPYGIPLRLSSNVNERSVRATVKEGYGQIIKDLGRSVELLPEEVGYKTRPNKSSAYALLARVQLSIGNYVQALECAKQSLKRDYRLMDYNTIDRSAAYPFMPLNQEVIYHGKSSASGSLMASSRLTITQDLLDSYSDDDLRKTAFFVARTPGRYRFKGFYNGSAASYFAGIAVDEMVLIAAECLIRTGKVGEGMEMLNRLLANRYERSTFVPRKASTELEALRIVLDERRKELPFRGIRWTDLRRLNRDPRFSKTIRRTYPNEDGKPMEVLLLPGDPRYCYYIPPQVIEKSGMVQTKR
jgi:tetratricopeptide (TPR) repeat protein